MSRRPTSIDTSVRTSIDTEPRDMVATLILVRDERGDLYDQEGHLRKATEVTQNRSISSPGHRSTTPTESTASCNAVRIMTHEEFAAKHPHPPNPVYVKIDRYSDPIIDRHQEPVIDRHQKPIIERHQETVFDRQQRAPIDRRAPITYRVQMPKIDVACLNALRPKPKPSENPPEAIRTPSDDGIDSMEVDRVPTGRNLRKRKEKVMFFRETRETEEYVRRMFCEAREKMRKRVTLKKKSDPGQFAIPCTVKGIEFPHALWDTGASVSILPRIMADHLGLQVKPSKESFTFVDCSQRNSGGIVRDLEVQIGNALVPVDFQVLDIKLNWNSSLLFGRVFLSTVGAVCNLQTNQLCLTLINPHVHYNPIPVKKPQTTPRRINDPGIIAACHCEAEYETEYSASIETHTGTSIDSAHQISTDTPKEESVDSSPEEWENDYYNPIMGTHNMHMEEYDEDYEEERAIEQRANLDEEDRHLHHSSWKKKSPSIDRNDSTSIDTQPHQPSHLRASTDIAYYPSIDTNVDATRYKDYLIGSWADDRHHESYSVETAYHDQGADELHEGFTYDEILNMQSCDETDQRRAQGAWGRTHFSHPIDRNDSTSIDTQPHQPRHLRASTDIAYYPSIDTNVDATRYKDYLIGSWADDRHHESYAVETAYHDQGADELHEGFTYDEILNMQSCDETDQRRAQDEFGIFRDSYGYAKAIDGRTLHVSREDIPGILQTANRADNLFMQQRTITEHQQKTSEFGRRDFNLFGTRKFYWEEKDEYGVYRDDQECTGDMDGHIINVSKEEIRNLMERASTDEHSYICLPEHASSFTQTKLVPEIYTKDEINEMFYGICGEQ
ncbi:hypothetical protein DY000_02021983 [Brassica cretica]|uniref:Aspartic peptidase DDI1-type domain-containing protein n=1 Tax=Brassica cretica TaxID=69181 RepID=A0ABQ7E3B4_BRACR|nr:hypothetical protein DY000_02021983 [Brassica cretica]